MIKKYRNGFLAAAIALTAVGCAGGDEAKEDDPLSGDIAGDLLGDDSTKAVAGARAIAQLLGGSLVGLIGTTADIFATFSVVSDPSSNAGKILSAKADEGNTASGAVTTVSAPCSNGGTFTMDIQLDILKDGEVSAVVPDIANGLNDFPNGVVDVALGMGFDMCNEPKHNYDGDESTAAADPDEDQVLDGQMIIRAHSDNKVKDAAGNVNASTKDFLLGATVTMKDYFIQQKPKGGSLGPVELITGEVGITLSTTDIDVGDFKTALDFGVTTSDKTNGGSTRTAVVADGTVNIDSSFAVKNYSLALSGSLRNFGGTAEGTYTLFTEAPIVSADGGSPSSGTIGIIDASTGFIHTAKVTATGLDFFIIETEGVAPVEGSCTWDEINNVDGKECDISI
ncbi:hypothetical protein [Marinagarivorans algicola]|uniref:hypothetical protein n=1 Tax=Marinagarivorans algicola TaxID=1513270 RepID=UPI0006B94C28|nr:hypothetical protein [Marinagarivorans algicola]